MDTVAQIPRSWQYWLLTTALITAFGWFAILGMVKCRCHEAVWHETQAKAGLVFVGIVFVRMVTAAILRDRHFKWQAYLVMCLLSPLWIWFVFELVLRIRDACAA